MRMLRWMFLSVTILAALPLALANYYINTKTEYGSAKVDTKLQSSGSGLSTDDAGEMAQSLLDDMLIFTAANVKGNGLWVHIGIEYVVTAMICLFGKQTYDPYKL